MGLTTVQRYCATALPVINHDVLFRPSSQHPGEVSRLRLYLVQA